MKKLQMMIIIALAIGLASSCWGSDTGPKAVDEAYYDTRTGHKYVKLNENVYIEFDRKGRQFKKVPADLPNLNNRNHVIPIDSRCYMQYSAMRGNQEQQMMLPADKGHPEGWMLEAVFTPVK
jgi:hypothetical protein